MKELDRIKTDNKIENTIALIAMGVFLILIVTLIVIAF